MQKVLLWSYYLCAVCGLAGSVWLGMAFYTAMQATPETSAEQAMVIAVVVGVISLVVTVAMPLIAAGQVKYRRGMLFPMIYAILIFALIPVGPLVGITQVVLAWKLHRPV
ncbi:hypothetical protein [Insolitispirillum peregrinum]|uniref:Uncharacterized protein n=1 Tax=Insolitispirillum peregrinum TaxID=80876 RepID=A0A1N7JA70_9PROT|nr:hypothetical protein [Insolitispirillum peregrinum]SIS46146.1 hypothetical protein SAMN05421779_10218 [Insolitispirillum peregrinum]